MFGQYSSWSPGLLLPCALIRDFHTEDSFVPLMLFLFTLPSRYSVLRYLPLHHRGWVVAFFVYSVAAYHSSLSGPCFKPLLVRLSQCCLDVKFRQAASCAEVAARGA